jgi:hypothetical protein
MIGLLTDSFQLATPDPRQGPVCGNDTFVKGRLCTPPELDIYYRVWSNQQLQPVFVTVDTMSPCIRSNP